MTHRAVSLPNMSALLRNPEAYTSGFSAFAAGFPQASLARAVISLRECVVGEVGCQREGRGQITNQNLSDAIAHFSEPFICLCQELRARFLFGPLCSLTAKQDDVASTRPKSAQGTGRYSSLLPFILGTHGHLTGSQQLRQLAMLARSGARFVPIPDA